MRSEVYVTAVLIVLAALNGLISFGIVRSAFYSRRQKAVQIGLVWLVPMLGPALVGVVLWSNFAPRVRSRGSDVGAAPALIAEDLAYSAAADLMRDADHL